MVFGAGLAAGLLGQIGDALGSHRLEQISDVVELGAAVRGALPAGALPAHVRPRGADGDARLARPVRRRERGRRRDLALGGRRTWPRSSRSPRRRSRAATSDASALWETRGAMVDTHCHLGICEPPDEELVAAAAAAGVTRMLTVGVDEAGSREAIAAAERFDSVWACVGRHPNNAGGFDDEDAAEIERLARHPRCAAVGETGLDFYRDRSEPADQRHAFKAHIGIARRVGKPLVIHVRDSATTSDGEALARDVRDPRRRGGRGDGDPALLLGAGLPGARGGRAGVVLLVRRQRHLPERRASCARRRGRFPTTCCWSRRTRRS